MGNEKVTTTISMISEAITPHDFTYPATSKLHAEMRAWAFYYPGAASHKFTGHVFHRTKRIAQDGHDLGNYLLHVNVPPLPTNPLLCFIVAGSSRKISFNASTVKMEGAATGCCNADTFTPMTACGDPTGIPMCIPYDHWFNSVLVGMTKADYRIGWATIAVSMVVDLVVDAIGADNDQTKGYDKTAKDLEGKGMGYLGKTDLKGFLKKTGMSLATGVVSYARTGSGSMSVELGGDKAKSQVELSYSDETGFDLKRGDSIFGQTTTVSTTEVTNSHTTSSLGTTTKYEEKLTKNPDGTKTKTTTTTTYDVFGNRTGEEVVTEDYDDGGNLVSSNTKTYGEPDNGQKDALFGDGDEIL